MNLTHQCIVIALLIFSSVAYSEENQQCDLISNLTGDYYQHRIEGMNKQQVIEQFRPAFANKEFLRVMDLAINMAYSFDEGQTRQQVIEAVYTRCTFYQK